MMEKYNIPEDEAKKYMQYTDEPIDDVDDQGVFKGHYQNSRQMFYQINT